MAIRLSFQLILCLIETEVVDDTFPLTIRLPTGEEVKIIVSLTYM
jgi:hypothetical protein